MRDSYYHRCLQEAKGSSMSRREKWAVRSGVKLCTRTQNRRSFVPIWLAFFLADCRSTLRSALISATLHAPQGCQGATGAFLRSVLPAGPFLEGKERSHCGREDEYTCSRIRRHAVTYSRAHHFPEEWHQSPRLREDNRC